MSLPLRLESSRIGAAPALTLVAGEPELAARIREGDRAAFEQLFRGYYRPLTTFVAGYVESAAVAEEIVQDVLLSVWRRRATWHVHDSVRSYLYGAARNAALIHRRHVRVVERWEAVVSRDAEAPGMGAEASPVDVAVEGLELADAVAREIGRLPERCRQVATLRIQHGLSYTEVAAVMGVTVKAVERQFTRGLKVLRAKLAGHL